MLKRLIQLLPGTDCQMCGMSCEEFAGYLVSGELTPDDCPQLAQEPPENVEKLRELLQLLARRAKSGHLIDTDKCVGCGVCVVVCEYNIANNDACRLGKGPLPGERVALQVIDGVVALVDENLCTRLLAAADKCSKCEEHCPSRAITLV